MSLNDFWNKPDRRLGGRVGGFWGSTAKPISSFGLKSTLDDSELESEGDSTGSTDLSSFCSSTDQCPSGYACVNGKCEFMSPNQTDSWQWNSPGSCGGQGAGTGGGSGGSNGSGCNSGGPGSCQQTPNCGEVSKPKPEECCGSRCCRYGLTSLTVNCTCGPCNDGGGGSECSFFCDSYWPANGISTMGCNEENTCSECETCDFFDRQCSPASDAPCWCDHVSCSDNCLTCVSNPSSGSFGGCVAAAPGACSVCTHVDSYQCPCGGVVGPITACSKWSDAGGSGYGGNVILTTQTATEIAEAKCASVSDCDECNKCETKTYCTDTNGSPPPCPDGSSCTQTGYIEVGGVTCILINECDHSGDPDSCQECCQCNCHSDCGPCEICAGDCTCAPDPACSTP